jgi:hypothetical protein
VEIERKKREEPNLIEELEDLIEGNLSLLGAIALEDRLVLALGIELRVELGIRSDSNSNHKYANLNPIVIMLIIE